MKKSEEMKLKALEFEQLSKEYAALEAKEAKANGGVSAPVAPRPAATPAVAKAVSAAPKAPVAKPQRKTEPIPKRVFPEAQLNERVLAALPANSEAGAGAASIATAVGEHRHWVSLALKSLADNNVVVKEGQKRGTTYRAAAAA